MTLHRSHCASCHADALVPFLDLGATPLADSFPASPYEAEPYYPLRVAVCEQCWLVQLLDVVPDEELYGADYGFYTGASPSAVAYFKDYARWAMDRFSREAKRLTVEVACNDGSLLRYFASAGFPAVGVEPAPNQAAMAADAGLEVLVKPFGRKAAADIISVHGYAGLVIANNVAAHVSDLHDFFGGLAAVMATDGVALVEFQYVADLITGNQFDHVYHEHRYFYSLSSLSAALAKHGLHVSSYTQTPAQGGSVRAVIRKGSEPLALDDEMWLRRPTAYAGMQGRVERIRESLWSMLHGERSLERVVAGYAASAKSTTLLNFCGLDHGELPFVLDTTPAKIGRYTPGTHIPIVDKGTADTYLLLAWNYLPGVLRREREFLDGGGRIIVPIPQPVLL